jgi:hypothetical protein
MARPGPVDISVNQLLRVEYQVPQAGTIHHLRTVGVQTSVASGVAIGDAQALCVEDLLRK